MDYLAYGPVPSRRLGRSLGVNNIPPKICSYSCVYCQLGITTGEKIERMEFYTPEAIYDAVDARLNSVLSKGESVDYITFVPDGEPTLDINIGKEIQMVKETGFRVAVITNSSLLWKEELREELMQADWVSVKVDTARADVWKSVNRPSGSLSHSLVIGGIEKFSQSYGGILATETMLVSGLNDGEADLRKTSRFISGLDPDISYLSVPTRPPAAEWVKPPEEAVLNQGYNIFKEFVDNVEFLTGYEGNLFAYSGNLDEDILGITSVHTMT